MRLALAVAVVVAALMDAPRLAAAGWPEKPVRIVVAYVAGGATDLVGRVYAQELSRIFGQRFYVENRAGGSGTIGTEFVARAAPDGYTLEISGMPSHVLSPPMNGAGFDPMKDFTHVAYLGGPPNVFVVHPSLGVATFADLLTLMRRTPEGLQYVSPGIGSVGNTVAEYIADREHIRLSHIVYRGGGSAIQDLLGGQVKVGSMTLSTTLPHIVAGELRALSVSSDHRLGEFPDVPTQVELGYPGLVVRTWCALSGPAGMAPEVTAKLNAAVNEAMQAPDLQRRLAAEMIEAEPMTPVQVTAFMQSQIDQWAETARRIAPGT